MFIEEDFGFTSGQIQDFEDEIEMKARRRAKIDDLQRQVRVLQGRLDAREGIIERQQAKIRRLQEIIAQQSDPVTA